MKRTAASVALLLALTGHPAAASVAAELSFGGIGTVAPVTFPFSFGTQSLGRILTVPFSLCFKKPASPAGACDATGTVGLKQQLAPPFYVAGSFRENIATGAKMSVGFPVNLGAGQRLVVHSQWVSSAVGPAAGSLTLRGTSGGSSDDIILAFTGSGVATGPCAPSTEAVCVNNGRFQIRSHLLTSVAAGGPANMVKLTSDTAYSHVFGPSNVEAVIKVLEACGFNNKYWTFAAGLTNVRTAITVTDTQRNAVRTYINPQGTPFQPIQDTAAFATCP